MDICWRKSVRRQCRFLGSQCGGIVVLGCRSRLWSCYHMLLYKYVCYYLWVPASSSVLWRCWLGGRKGIQPVKTEWWGAGVVICLERGADLHMAQLMPLLLTVSCFSKIQIGFAFLIPAHPGSPGEGSVQRVCVCACMRVHVHPLRRPSTSSSSLLHC